MSFWSFFCRVTCFLAFTLVSNLLPIDADILLLLLLRLTLAALHSPVGIVGIGCNVKNYLACVKLHNTIGMILHIAKLSSICPTLGVTIYLIHSPSFPPITCGLTPSVAQKNRSAWVKPKVYDITFDPA